MCRSVDDQTTLIMFKRLLPDWMNPSPAPKRRKPAPKRLKTNPVREIPDDMDAGFREEDVRNSAVGSAYARGINRTQIYLGPPTPPNERRRCDPASSPRKLMMTQYLIGPQQQELEWHEEFMKHGTYPHPFVFEEWIQKTFGPAAATSDNPAMKRWIDLRYMVFQDPDIHRVVKAHKKFDEGETLTPPFSRESGTPHLLDCEALGIPYGPEDEWYGTKRHGDSKWNQDKPYGPALADITRYNLEDVRDKLEKWLQNGAYRRTYKRAYQT